MSPTTPTRSTTEDWPALPWEEWRETCQTLHLWTQIIGKIRMESSPWVNHSWGVTLYVTSSGLTTSAIPGRQGTFQIDFNFLSHELESWRGGLTAARVALGGLLLCLRDGRALEARHRGLDYSRPERD